MKTIQHWLFAALIIALPAFGQGQEVVVPEVISSPAISNAPFAVGGSARQGLPPVDCWRCYGPGACPPCDCHHVGFLYYETCPWDDDAKNGFDDCPGGECGYVAVGLSRVWIHWRESRPQLLRKLHQRDELSRDACDGTGCR